MFGTAAQTAGPLSLGLALAVLLEAATPRLVLLPPPEECGPAQVGACSLKLDSYAGSQPAMRILLGNDALSTLTIVSKIVRIVNFAGQPVHH
ncbi:hypothetical protein SAMN05518866_10878 [Sphingobium sp. YR768]|nr:hypothetical protein SAMN05518866_10878 [Sphingobium sp. YR768]